MLTDYLILFAAVALPVGLMLVFVYGLNWWAARQRLRVPVAEKLLRAPGESLRRQLEDTNEQFSLELTLTLLGSLMFASLLLAQQRHPQVAVGPVGLTIDAVVGVAGFGWVCWRVARLRKRRVRLRLGFLGERAVGEELNLLMREGAHVFHDVPGTTPKWNVDHVLVAPTGVYAIETKTRRKREQVPGGEAAHKVVCDGRTLRFPGGGTHSGDLDQARRQASSLADELSKATGEPVAVQAVLALPGWFVDRTGRGDVIVISAKALKCLVRGKAVLDPTMVGRIAHQLDRRCRDVEF